MTTVIRLDTAELDRIVAHLDSNKEEILERFANEVEWKAKQLAPVAKSAKGITGGTLMNSIHTKTKHGGSKPGPVLRPHVTVEELPEPGGNVVAIVGSGVDYAAYQELGTYKMAAHPYLGPAVEAQAKVLNDGSYWRKLIEK